MFRKVLSSFGSRDKEIFETNKQKGKKTHLEDNFFPKSKTKLKLPSGYPEG